MPEPTLDDELSRAERALERLHLALETRPSMDEKLREEMGAVLADLDRLIASAERGR
jgi:hypothetical protein